MLAKIHKMMLELENQAAAGGGTFEPAAVARLQQLLQALASHEDPEYRRLAAIAPHLHSQMTLKHYVSWIVPVERVLQKQLRDDEFLIFTQDGSQKALPKVPLFLVLHNLRSAFNVGAIFRTAECFGVQKIYLCGYTPLPTQDKLAKTAMGTESLIEWEEVPKITELLPRLRTELATHIVALETTSHAVSIESPFPPEGPTALVLGNERFGLDPEVLSLCAEVRKIPLRGQKNSLNVGIATAIATYEFCRQWQDLPNSQATNSQGPGPR